VAERRGPADIAVLGAGLAGLAAAWWLGREHRVTLYERHGEPGFTAASLALPPRNGGGPGPRVDVPLRVFYPGYYPTLMGLYGEIGARTEPVSYATSFFGRDGATFFRYRNLMLGGQSVGVVPPSEWLRSSTRAIAIGAWTFWRALRRDRDDGRLDGQTLADFLGRHPVSPAFVDGLLLPMVCTVATCSSAQALAYPASVVADYLLRGVTREPVRRAVDGADDVARRLLERVATTRFGADIRAVKPDATGVTLVHGRGPTTRHDHVVVATSARQALALLAEPRPDERRCLGRVDHTPVTVVVHRDPAVMPRQRSDWSPVNAGIWPGQDQAMATIWVNRVQPALRRADPVFQTVAPCVPLAPSLVLGEARFERPLVTLRSLGVAAALEALHAQADRRVWFCGSYAGDGVPLLESAVSSARRVAQVVAERAGRAQAPARARRPLKAA
jgi:predicted NAD/FAD-binding protein